MYLDEAVEEVALDLMRKLALPLDRMETDEPQYAARADIRIILGEDSKPLPVATVTPTPAPLPVLP